MKTKLKKSDVEKLRFHVYLDFKNFPMYIKNQYTYFFNLYLYLI